MTLPQVCVLMSTYNGEKYIREQIDSILRQKDVEVKLLIRDDGSYDSTISICKEYEKQNPNVSFYQGENIGVGKSFLELLRNAPKGDYYSFADQDDVWLDYKLARAVSKIKKAGATDVSSYIGKGCPIICDTLPKAGTVSADNVIPVLYGSNLMKVDEQLNILGLRFKDIPKCDLLSCISRNVVYGCTMVMNTALRDICINTDIPSEKVLDRKNHDAWVLYIAFITGIFIYDSESFIRYREHADQLVGAKELTGYKVITDKAGRFFEAKNKGVRSALAADLLERFSDRMDPDIFSHLEILSNAGSAAGIKKLVNDKELAESFGESNEKIIMRGLIGWI